MLCTPAKNSLEAVRSQQQEPHKNSCAIHQEMLFRSQPHQRYRHHAACFRMTWPSECLQQHLGPADAVLQRCLHEIL